LAALALSRLRFGIKLMQILLKETLEVAIIDPGKKIGEEGQYLRYSGSSPSLAEIINDARGKGFEIRSYVENIPSENGGIIPLKYVITEIPPMHVQPFHSHTNVDEINLISSGEVHFIESDTLSEKDIDLIRAQGIVMRDGDVVVSSSGKRHTVANLSDKYAFIIGTISAKNSVHEFKPDWQR